MLKKFVGDKFPYLLVEESLIKCQATERFRARIAQKVGERADIELQYIKKIQDWINDLEMPITRSGSIDDYLQSEVMMKILDGMRLEAHLTADSRQQLYNSLMSESGPYFNLQQMPVDDTQRVTKETEIHFRQLYRSRNDIDKKYKDHCEMYEHLRNQTEALESQLAKTSRIASARRPPSRNGMRKIDAMREQVSELRQKCNKEEISIDKSEKELKQTELVAQQFLEDMERTLMDIEMARIQTLINEIQSYIKYIQKHQTRRSQSGTTSNSPLGRLDSAQKLVKLHWLDVRSRAKQGDSSKMQEMFESSNPATKKRFVSVKNVLSKIMADDSKQSSESRTFERTESLLAHFNSRKSGSESSVDEEDRHGEGTSAMGLVSNMEYKRGTSNSNPSIKQSQESIESLVLPPEVKCKAEISNLEPNKQYITRMKLAKHEELPSPRAHVTEYSNVSRYVSLPTECHEVEDEYCVGKLHNVRVVAVEDSDPPPDSELLAFKRGQIIKQKLGENENGFCYGWTRENRLGKKQYGTYKTSMVRLFKKSSNI